MCRIVWRGRERERERRKTGRKVKGKIELTPGDFSRRNKATSRNSKEKKKKERKKSGGCIGRFNRMIAAVQTKLCSLFDPLSFVCRNNRSASRVFYFQRGEMWRRFEQKYMGIARWFTVCHSDEVKNEFSNYIAVSEAFSINQICVSHRSKINSFTFWNWIL